jgi:hypothetical protein
MKSSAKSFSKSKWAIMPEWRSLKEILMRWIEKWIACAQGSNHVVSFSECGYLTEGYFADSLKALGIEEFKSAILS